MGNCQNDHHAQSDDDESISVIKAPIGYGKGGFEKDDLVVAERAEEMYGHYEIEEELGKGAYGSVFKVEEKRTKDVRVCKEVGLTGLSDADIKNMKMEIETLKKLDHPHIVKLFEYAEEGDKLYLIMEMLPGGDMIELLERKGAGLDEKFVAKAMRQLIAPLEYCHDMNILHRDVKPDNMMLTEKKGFFNDPDIKVIDFGLAKACECAKTTTDDAISGTLAYMSPELITKQPFGSPTDLWSAGVVCYKLLTNELPFGAPEVSEIQQYINKLFKEEPDYEDGPMSKRSDLAVDFVQQLLIKNPFQRITASQALEHPWLEKYAPVSRDLGSGVVKSMTGFSKAPRFTQVCCLIIAAQSSAAELQKYSNIFDGLDEDRSGTVDVEELKDALVSQGGCWGGGLDDANAEKIALSADLNNNGQVSFSEFAAASIYFELKTGGNIAQKAFEVFDHNVDGYISLQDVQQVVEKPHVKEAESALGIDYLDLIRPAFKGNPLMDFSDFKKLLASK